jgi:methionyl-tRNA synthetase
MNPQDVSVPLIKYDDFVKVDLRVGTIKEARLHAKADKLVVLKVDLGKEERQIVAGIKLHYAVEQLLNKQIIVVTNLEPRDLRGEVSHGMLLAASNDTGLALLTVDKEIAAGSKVG